MRFTIDAPLEKFWTAAASGARRRFEKANGLGSRSPKRRRGRPIGSGPVESACRQRQCRFKRPGQLGTPKGMRHLSALTEARHNHHWDELWITA